MADVLPTQSAQSYSGFGLFLDRSCKALAVLAGLMLTLMAFMSLSSVVGRSLFDKAVVGDYELVQVMSAVAVSLSLPYANWIGAQVIVDFFTSHTAPKTNALLDFLAYLVMTFFAVLLTWRMSVGLADLKASEDASMLLNLPTWWGYVPMVLAFALLALTAGYRAWSNFKELGA